MLESDFEDFWRAYPRKVGKFAARKAYEKARRSGQATQAELLAGVQRYITHKPAYADWCHASTWLNGGRWMDDYDSKPATSPSPQHGAYAEWVPYHRRKESA